MPLPHADSETSILRFRNVKKAIMWHSLRLRTTPFETTDSTVFVRTGLRRSASFQHSDEAWKSMLRPASQSSSTAGTAALDQQCHSPIQVLPPSQGKRQWLSQESIYASSISFVTESEQDQAMAYRPTNDKRGMFAT